MRFGSEADIEKGIQILHSSILRDSIVYKYHLFSHYGIDTNSPKKNYLMNEEYEKKIRFEQSRYNSIEIDVYDNDPVLAAKIANDIVKMADRVKNGIIKKNLKTAYDIISRELNDKIKEIGNLGDSIVYMKHKNYTDAINLQKSHLTAQRVNVDDLRNSIVGIRSQDSIYDMEFQYNSIYTSYLKAVADYMADSGIVQVMSRSFKPTDTSLVRKEGELKGQRILTIQLKNKLAKLNHSDKKYNELIDNYQSEKGILGGLKNEYEIATSTFEKEFNNLDLQTLKDKYTSELQLYNIIKTKYELALSNLTDQVPASYIISPAEVPSIKAYPQRLLATALISLGMFVFSILFFAIYDSMGNIRQLIKD